MALIILGHPHFDRSFANKTIIEELQRSDLPVEVRNIHYSIDAKAEQDALSKHRTIVFQYPIYWYSMPAILKHWFDVVFEYQFAYGTEGDKLKNKNFVPSFTVGSAEQSYSTLQEHHFRVYEFCKHLEQIAYYKQMNYIDPIYVDKTSLAAGYSEAEVKHKAKNHAKRLIKCLSELG